MLMVQEEEDEKHGAGQCEEPREPRSDGRLCEGVHGTDDSATGEEGSPDRQPEAEEDEPHVPYLEHAALLLHHHRMQKGGADEPRHQRSVFDRIPSPVTAPSENGVCP